MIFNIRRTLVKGFSAETKVASWEEDTTIETDDYRFCIIRVVPDGSVDFSISFSIDGDDYIIDEYTGVTEPKLIKVNCYGMGDMTVNVTGTADVYLGNVDYD